MAKGNFIDYITSDDPNKYPSNDVHTDGYYYKKVTNISTIEKEEKTVTALMTQLIVTPDKGKLLSKVTINPPVIPKNVSVTTMPSKTSYKAGETLDLAGIAVNAEMSDGTTKDITSECTFSPASGTVLYEDVKSVSVAWNFGDITYSISLGINVTRVLSSISIKTNPSKTEYYKGDALDLTGIEVTATYTSGTTEDVTASITSSPASGAALNENGNQTVTVSYAENGVTKTATFTISVSVKIVTWAGGTDEEVANMVAAADAGVINLADYWTVGDERQVTLSAMSATGVGESHVEQTVTFVLMNAGGKTLANATASGRTTCSFIVGMKNGLAEKGYMNSSNTNSGGWESSKRRTWCNNVFRNAIPSTLRDIFKQHLNITANGSGYTTATSTDYFALPAEKEVFGSETFAVPTTEASLTQFEYYKTSANRIKTQGDAGSAGGIWWERSPYSGNQLSFCVVANDSVNYSNTSYARLLAPFGCI